MALAACAAALSTGTGAHAAVTWPAGQLLPSLSTPASTQDLISLVTDHVYPATASTVAHKTGHDDGDGWLCQVGIDTPNAHMLYGQYDTSLPPGQNAANFNMKIDDNAGDDDDVCVIDARDATTSTVLATKTITRHQFNTPTATQPYQTFSLPFVVPASGHSMEFRVLWSGKVSLKVKNISIQRSPESDSVALFASLKGIVNSTQPRIFAFDGNSLNEEGQFTWLDSLGLGYAQVSDNWSLITKYRSEIKGLIVYDDNQPDTINLATTIAGHEKALVAPPMYLSKLTSAPYNLPILVDLRGKYTDKLAVYQDLYDTYWAQSTHRAIVGLDPMVHVGAAREYAAAINAAVIWLDPRVPAENALLGRFLSSMGAGPVYCGWWPEEASGVGAASTYGIATCASDWSTNLSVFSGMSRTVKVKKIPPKPTLQNKIYVAFVISDGDNLQYVEHRFRRLWSDPGRGKVPMGWTLSPVMLDAMPAALNYLYKTASTNDCLLSGPSGYGYTYPNNWGNAAFLDSFVAKSNDYCRRAGFKIITVWNTINGGINENVGKSYAANAPSLLGLTAQNAGAGLTIFDKTLPSEAFAANYCPTIESINMQIRNNSAGWSGKSPLFLIVQAQPWGDVTPTGLVGVKNALNSNYIVVRPDTIFQLIMDANHLPIKQ